MVFVTFRRSSERLTNMFSCAYKTVEDAKKGIEADAKFFVQAHRLTKKHTGYGKKVRQRCKWIDPKLLDYYEARAQDGTICTYQYWDRC